MATTTLHPRRLRPTAARLYEWLTTTDHKKIGILYLVNSFIFFFARRDPRPRSSASSSRSPACRSLNEEFYNQAFTMHGTFMIFLFIIPILAGFGNYVVPLQIGAPDMAFPRINALSFWLLPLGGLLMASGFLVPAARPRPAGRATRRSRGRRQYNGTGTDLWIMGLVLIGTSSILGAINFLVTIFKMRAPGMTLFRMPILVWTVLVTSVLVLHGDAGPHERA